MVSLLTQQQGLLPARGHRQLLQELRLRLGDLKRLRDRLEELAKLQILPIRKMHLERPQTELGPRQEREEATAPSYNDLDGLG
jgi:hypothetical protein